MNLTEELKDLRMLKENRDIAKADFEQEEAAFKQQQRKVMELMQETGVESMKLEGVNFVPTETVYATVNDRSEFVKWAEENDDELLEPREVKEVLNSLVREHLDDGSPLPPGVGFYVREYISQRAA